MNVKLTMDPSKIINADCWLVIMRFLSFADVKQLRKVSKRLMKICFKRVRLGPVFALFETKARVYRIEKILGPDDWSVTLDYGIKYWFNKSKPRIVYITNFGLGYDRGLWIRFNNLPHMFYIDMFPYDGHKEKYIYDAYTHLFDARTYNEEKDDLIRRIIRQLLSDINLRNPYTYSDFKNIYIRSEDRKKISIILWQLGRYFSARAYNPVS